MTDTNAAPRQAGECRIGDRRRHHRLCADRRAPDLRRSQLSQQPDRPPGTARRSRDPLRHGRCAARRAIRARARCQSRGDRNPVRKLLEGAPPTARSRWSNSSITPAPIARRATRIVDRLLQEDKGLRVVYRELPILGPDSVTAARLSLAASKAGPLRAVPRCIVGRRPPAPGHDRDGSAGGRALPARRRTTRRSKPSSSAISSSPGQLGATGTPLFVVGDRVMNGAVGYDALKQAIAQARAKGERLGAP